MSGELIKVGKYDLKYNKILDIDIAELDICLLYTSDAADE